jgi:hypothetical protein
MAAHDWATWYQNTCQNNATCHQMIHPIVNQSENATSPLSRQRTVIPCQHPYGMYRLHSQRPFF